MDGWQDYDREDALIDFTIRTDLLPINFLTDNMVLIRCSQCPYSTCYYQSAMQVLPLSRQTAVVSHASKENYVVCKSNNVMLQGYSTCLRCARRRYTLSLIPGQASASTTWTIAGISFEESDKRQTCIF